MPEPGTTECVLIISDENKARKSDADGVGMACVNESSAHVCCNSQGCMCIAVE